MERISRIFLFGVLTLILLTACAGQQGSPTAVGTIAPGNETALPPLVGTDTTGTAIISPDSTLNTTATIDTATALAGTDATQSPGLPVTGTAVILLEGQFCIEGMAHALLVLPDTATFQTVADTATLSTPGPDTGCNTVETLSGRQLVICRAPQNTSLNLNICTDGNNCTQLLVELQSCPETNPAQAGPTNPPGAVAPTDTPAVGLPTNTPGAGTTETPSVIPTSTQ